MSSALCCASPLRAHSHRCRRAYLGLTMSLRSVSFLVCIPGFLLLRQQVRKEQRNAARGALANGGAEMEALGKDEMTDGETADRETGVVRETTARDRETRL